MEDHDEYTVYELNAPKAVEFYEKRLNLGKLDSPDINVSYTGPCGETMEFFIILKENSISNITFQYDGCSVLSSCGSAVCEMVRGKDILSAAKIKPEDVKGFLGVGDDKKIDCPFLAVNTLKKAAEEYKKSNA
ncbi:MAG: iron-sulfur cluster assembly scaffold protein [Nanobdellota archaeon]